MICDRSSDRDYDRGQTTSQWPVAVSTAAEPLYSALYLNQAHRQWMAINGNQRHKVAIDGNRWQPVIRYRWSLWLSESVKLSQWVSRAVVRWFADRWLDLPMVWRPSLELLLKYYFGEQVERQRSQPVTTHYAMTLSMLTLCECAFRWGAARLDSPESRSLCSFASHSRQELVRRRVTQTFNLSVFGSTFGLKSCYLVVWRWLKWFQ